MTQAADRRVARDRPALELRRSELLLHVLELGLGHLTAPDEPAPGLRERDPHEPAAAFAGTAGERDHRAEGHEIAGQVVDRRHRIELRTRRRAGKEITLAARDA